MSEYLPRASTVNAKRPSALVTTDCDTARSVPCTAGAMATDAEVSGCPVRTFTTTPARRNPCRCDAAGGACKGGAGAPGEDCADTLPINNNRCATRPSKPVIAPSQCGSGPAKAAPSDSVPGSRAPLAKRRERRLQHLCIPDHRCCRKQIQG